MGAGGRVRVLVADDHPLYREALADTVRQRPDLELVAKVASGREALAEILGLTADGCSAPQIAEQLYLSPTTVRTHLQHLYDKLGVSDRAAAVAEAMRQRLLE